MTSTYQDLLEWLRDALLGRIETPKLTSDEPPFAAILYLEPGMTSEARRDLRAACEALVRELAVDGCGPDEYVRGLLAVASRLGCSACASDLARLARRPDLAPARLRLVLEGLNMLGAPQPVDFWRDMLLRDPRELAIPALKGLLLTDWREGLAYLADMPDEPTIASAAASLIDRSIKDTRPLGRAVFLHTLRGSRPRCRDGLRVLLDDILLRETR